MRLTAIALAEGCTKLTLSCAPTLKLFQVSEAFWLDWVMVVLAPLWEMAAEPEVTWPSTGPACAVAAPSSNTAVTGLRRAHPRTARPAPGFNASEAGGA